jgi:uncharacterized membrane protein HdeD (DUF308 family)
MFRSPSRSFVWRGLLAIAIGITAIVWPGVTILALVIIFAIGAFTDAWWQGFRAFSSDGAWPVLGRLLLGAFDIAAGVVALAWPGITAFVLLIWIGAWALVTGVGEFAMAFASHESEGNRALFGLGGLLSVAFGAVLFARPGLGALALADVLGFFSLAYGVWSLVASASVREAGGHIDSVLRSRA